MVSEMCIRDSALAAVLRPARARAYLGAAGLPSSCVEAASRAGTGIDIDVAKVPRRERGMSPYEVMLSESQERMLVIPKRSHLDDVLELFRRWELRADVIGTVTDDTMATVRDGDAIVARFPVEVKTDPPLYLTHFQSQLQSMRWIQPFSCPESA